MRADVTSTCSPLTIMSTLDVTKMACWRTSSVAIWWKSAQQVYLLIRPRNSTTHVNGICRRLLRFVCTVVWAATLYPANVTERFAALSIATTMKLMVIFYVTAAALDMNLSTARSASASHVLNR